MTAATPDEPQHAELSAPEHADDRDHAEAATVVTSGRRASTRRVRTVTTAVGGVAAIAVIGLALASFASWGLPAQVLTVSAETTGPSPSSASIAPSESPTAKAIDMTSADSVTVLVNKHHSLDPNNYTPAPLVKLTEIGVPSMNNHSLRKDAAEAVQEMFAAAQQEGIQLDMTSGYRSYELQQQLYDGYVANLGQEAADLTSARPGSSEHQTGLAADISAPGESDCILTACFGDTNAGKWLAEHAPEYGFILRYPKGQTEVTGYEYEPWHFRFIGKDAAAEYAASGAATYEEFLGSEPAPTYPA